MRHFNSDCKYVNAGVSELPSNPSDCPIMHHGKYPLSITTLQTEFPNKFTTHDKCIIGGVIVISLFCTAFWQCGLNGSPYLPLVLFKHLSALVS